jgi:hypothetical protein
MKHYHDKQDLGNNDVRYIVVSNGQQYRLDFKNVATEFEDIPIKQGIKFWLNRCKLIIDNNIIPTDRIIIWYSQDNKKSIITGEHFHYFTDHSVTFQVTETVDENPNLGIFNVWTTDNKRCYEFAGNSYIEEVKKEDDNFFYKARQGWTKLSSPTIEFEILKLS